MKKVTAFLAIAACHLGACGAARAADLSPGTYGVSSYFVSAQGAGGGNCNFFPKGTSLFSEYTFPGYSKPGATVRTYINGLSVQYVVLDTYPVTPPKGATTWSGNITESFLPGGTSSTGTFSTNFTIVDSKSYVDNTTYIFPSNGGTCTSVVQHVGILTGK